jgi:hypothetical protein
VHGERFGGVFSSEERRRQRPAPTSTSSRDSNLHREWRILTSSHVSDQVSAAKVEVRATFVGSTLSARVGRGGGFALRRTSAERRRQRHCALAWLSNTIAAIDSEGAQLITAPTSVASQGHDGLSRSRRRRSGSDSAPLKQRSSQARIPQTVIPSSPCAPINPPNFEISSPTRPFAAPAQHKHKRKRKGLD